MTPTTQVRNSRCKIILPSPPRLNKYSNRPKSTAERFWSKVDKRAHDECWLWRGRKTAYGYGGISCQGRPWLSMTASRVSWEINNGPIPEGLLVCHSCDIRYPVGDLTYRLCVNPSHLFLGTHKDNSQDCANKGRNGSQRYPERRPRGEKNKASMLTEQQVQEIRHHFDEGWKIADIARTFDTSWSNVGRIVRGEIWKHVV